MPHCVRRGPSSSPPKGAQQPPVFGPCLGAIVATVVHLSYCWAVVNLTHSTGN